MIGTIAGFGLLLVLPISSVVQTAVLSQCGADGAVGSPRHFP